MKYHEDTPSNELSPFVKCFWEYENMGDFIQHTILPNGYFELFMIFQKQKLISVFMSGLRTKPFNVYIPKGVKVSAVRFRLSASEYIFDREIGSIKDTILTLSLDFWALNALESLSFSDRNIEITNKIFSILKEKEIDHEKLSLLETVYNPDLNVRDVSNTTQWDRRKINRYFNSQFGLPLKTFLSIIRLRSSFERIKGGDLHPGLNYYDQSHYIKEVRKYTRESPKNLLKNEDDRFLQFSLNKKP